MHIFNMPVTYIQSIKRIAEDDFTKYALSSFTYYVQWSRLAKLKMA